MKLFYPTQEQINVLVGLIRDTAQKMVEINFNVPAEDEATIRYHAYLRGKMEILKSLLADDFDVEQPPQPESQT